MMEEGTYRRPMIVQSGGSSSVYDLEITEEELAYVKGIRRKSILSKEQIRMLHAKVFMSAIAQFSADKEISDREVLKLRRLSQCLQTLGWAPGQ